MNKINLMAVKIVNKRCSKLLAPRSSLLPPRSSLLALRSLLLALLLPLAAEAMPQKLTYRGMLRTDGSAVEAELRPLTFAIYDSAAPGSAALWSRTILTKVETNGVFYTELEDGNVVSGNTLADAFASAGGVPEIAVSDGSGAELAPRAKFSTWVRGARVLRTKGVDLVSVRGEAIVPGTAGVFELYADRVTVEPGGSGQFPSDCWLTPMRQRTLGDGSTVTLKDVLIKEDAWPYADARKENLFTTDSALSDAVVTYENADGAFSLVVPQGGQITGKEAAGTVHTVSLSAFGPMTSSIK